MTRKKPTDKQRLNFIERGDGRITRWTDGRWNCAIREPKWHEGEGLTLRAAIDAAMKAERSKA